MLSKTVGQGWLAEFGQVLNHGGSVDDSVGEVGFPSKLSEISDAGRKF